VEVRERYWGMKVSVSDKVNAPDGHGRRREL